MLLYPLRGGDSAPDTTWTARRLTIALPRQSDVLDFTTGGDGRTRFTVGRDGIAIAAMQ